MERIRQKLTGNYTLTADALDDEGTVFEPVAPATVEIFDGAGASVYTTTTTIPAVPADPPPEGDPPAAATSFSATIPATELPLLDTYRCVWTDDDGTTVETLIDLCGGHLFTVADLRATDPSYADASRYPLARIQRARLAAELRFEQAAGLAYVRRGRRLTLRGDGSSRLRVLDTEIHTVRSASIDGTAFTADQLAELTPRVWGAIDRPAGLYWTDRAEITIHYEHGLDYPPEPVSQAVMTLTSEYLTRKALSSRAVTEVTDVGTFNLSVAGFRKPTGIPEVDRIVQDYGRRTALVG
jgi:hypothetical protein